MSDITTKTKTVFVYRGHEYDTENDANDAKTIDEIGELLDEQYRECGFDTSYFIRKHGRELYQLLENYFEDKE